MKKIFKKLLVIGSYFWRVWLDMEKEQRLRFSIYCLQYCLRERERDRESDWVCVYLKTNQPTNHEYTFTCIKEKTAHLRSWARRLNAGAFGCGQLACSQSWCPYTPEGLTGPFLQQALPRCRRNGQVRENALTPQLGERVWMNTSENPTSEQAEQGDDREGLGNAEEGEGHGHGPSLASSDRRFSTVYQKTFLAPNRQLSTPSQPSSRSPTLIQ